MGWQELPDWQKIGIVAAAALGVGYFTGGGATAYRHRRVLEHAQAGYQKNADLLHEAKKALKGAAKARSKLATAEARGRIGKALFGDEIFWAERLRAHKDIARLKAEELHERQHTLSSSQVRRLAKLDEAIKELPGLSAALPHRGAS